MRTRKQKKWKARKLGPLFSKKELRKLAARSWKYRPFDICNLAKIPYKERAVMFTDTSAMLQGQVLSGHEMEILQYFITTLKNISKVEVTETRKKEAELLRKRESRLKVIREHKKKMVELAQAHPLGRIIGQTQVCEFKSPRTNIQWASKRKRKQ